MPPSEWLGRKFIIRWQRVVVMRKVTFCRPTPSFYAFVSMKTDTSFLRRSARLLRIRGMKVQRVVCVANCRLWLFADQQRFADWRRRFAPPYRQSIEHRTSDDCEQLSEFDEYGPENRSSSNVSSCVKVRRARRSPWVHIANAWMVLRKIANAV